VTERPVPWHGEPAPSGYEYVARADLDWVLMDGTEKANRCRYMVNRKGCGRPAVARLNRAGRRDPGPLWWAYCAEHLYGRWMEDGHVMEWIIRKREETEGDQP
jgi:hypothetical protein